MVYVFDIVKFIVLVIVTYFTCNIITNNNKRISYIGVLLICFSSAIVTYINSGLVEAIIFSEMIFISINKLQMNSKYKYIFVFIIPICILGFLLLSNISFQVVIGVTTLALILWELLHFKNENNDKKVIGILIISCIIAVILGSVFYKYNPIKPAEKIQGIKYLFSYTYNSFSVFDKSIKYKDISCLSTFISVFPVSLLIGIVYIFKEESKHLKFIVPTVLISILELILILSNIILNFLPTYILVLGFNLLQIYMIIYIFSRVEDKLFSLTKSAYIALAILIIFMFMPIPAGLNKLWLDISSIILVLESFMVLNYTDRRFWRLSSWVFSVICLFNFVGSLIVNFV